MAMNKRQLQKKGPKGHKLAHITPLEGVILKALGGSGKVNPRTKIKQYDTTEKTEKEKDEEKGDTRGGTGGGPQQQDDPPPPPPPPPPPKDDKKDDFQYDYPDYDDKGDVIKPPPTEDTYDYPEYDEKGNIINTGGTGDGGGKTNWSYNPFDYFFGDMTPDWGRWYREVFKPWFTQKHGREPTKEEKEQSRIKLLAEQNQEDGGNTTVLPGDDPPDPVWTDWEGNEYKGPTGEADKDAANQAIRDTKLGEIEGFGYGDDGTFSGTEYVSTYEQMLADAYSAAQRGSNREIMKLGYDPGTGVTEGDLTEQEEWLTGLGTDYQAKNKAMYDTWYGENMAKINALGTKELVDAYVWTDQPAYDLDYTGGSAYGTDTTAEDYVYDPDYEPEFFEGFNLEFEPGYSDPTMPAEWGGHPEGYVGPDEEVEGGDGSVESEPILESPPLKRRKTKGAYVGLSPFSSGSGRII